MNLVCAAMSSSNLPLITKFLLEHLETKPIIKSVKSKTSYVDTKLKLTLIDSIEMFSLKSKFRSVNLIIIITYKR